MLVVVALALVSTGQLQAEDTVALGDVLLTDDEVAFFAQNWSSLFADMEVDVSLPNWADVSRQAKMNAVAHWLIDGTSVADTERNVVVSTVMITVICASPEAPNGIKDRISGTITTHADDLSSQSIMTWIRLCPSSQTTISVHGLIQLVRDGQDSGLIEVRRTYIFESGEWNESERELQWIIE